MTNYDVLGVSRNATKPEIRKAYHKLCMMYHPDKGGNTEQFIKIKKAYDELMTFNPNKTHNIHYERKSEATVNNLVNLSNYGNRSFEHTFMFTNMLFATVVVRGQAIARYDIRGDFFIEIKMLKKDLIDAKYEYDILFTSKNNEGYRFSYKYNDPRSFVEKFIDKYISVKKVASFVKMAIILFILSEIIQLLIKHT